MRTEPSFSTTYPQNGVLVRTATSFSATYPQNKPFLRTAQPDGAGKQPHTPARLPHRQLLFNLFSLPLVQNICGPDLDLAPL